MTTLGHGKICHLALPAQDAETSARFYEDVFGWEIRHDGPVTRFDDGVAEVSGHFVPHRAASEPGLMIYLWVEDLTLTLARLTAAGAEILAGPGVDSGERTAWFRDPGGNTLGVYQEPDA